MGEQISTQAHLTITDTTDLEWFYGTDLTHTSGTAVANIVGAAVGSMYLNTQTSLAYKCTAVAANGDQTWQYVGNMASGVLEATQEAIDNIEIGGRNLLLKTGETHISAGSADQNVYITSYSQSPYLALQTLVVNETIFTLSFDYEVVNNSAVNAVIWPHFHGNMPTVANTIASNANRPETNKVYMYVNDNPSGHYWVTFKVSTAQLSGSANINRVRLRYATDGATLKISNMKLEFGNKATDWTPAPEDIDTSISEVDSKTNEAASKVEQVSNTLSSANDTIQQQGSAIQALQKITAPITLDTRDENNPAIVIQAGASQSEQDNNTIYSRLILSKERISFHKVYDVDGDSSTDDDQIDTQVLFIDSTEKQGVIDINNARIQQSIKIGNLEIIAYQGGIAVRRS